MEEQYKNISSSNPIELNGNDLTINDLHKIAYQNNVVKLSEESVSKILACRKMVEDKISEGEIVYGINTGIGEFSETILDDSQIEDFQKYLIYNHSAGI